MNPSEYRTMYSVEDRHWWYVGMRRVTTTLVAESYGDGRGLDILDAGCGTGAAMTYLAAFGRVTGCDISPLALGFCRQRHLTRLSQASITRLPYAGASFDLVASFDVLCHQTVLDYHQTLAEFRRVLRPGGRLLLRLPAYNWLRSHHDEAVHTARRFSSGEVRAALVAVSFVVEKISYANTLLFPLVAARRLFERVRPRDNGEESDVHPNPAWQDALLSRLLFAEAAWLRRGALPYGLTVVAIGRKPTP